MDPNIEFACDCGTRLRAKRDQAGKHAQCPTCKRTVPIPGQRVLPQSPSSGPVAKPVQARPVSSESSAGTAAPIANSSVQQAVPVAKPVGPAPVASRPVPQQPIGDPLRPTGPLDQLNAADWQSIPQPQAPSSTRPVGTLPSSRKDSNALPWIIGGVIGGLGLLGVISVVAVLLLFGDQPGGTAVPEVRAVAPQPRVRSNVQPSIGLSLPDLPTSVRAGRPYTMSMHIGAGPASKMRMRIRVPVGFSHEALGQYACVLIAPAGTPLLYGNDIGPATYTDEVQPYLDAGMCVIEYSIDGAVDDPNDAEQLSQGFKDFRLADAGVRNGKRGIDFVTEKMPQVDKNRIYSAGHSSAATLSLLLAAKDRRVKKCVAYAPITDLKLRIGEEMPAEVEHLFPGFRGYVNIHSPINVAGLFRCPVFVFHARDDSNEPFENTQVFVDRMRRFRKRITFSPAASGDHYQSMIDEGIPKAIAWLEN